MKHITSKQLCQIFWSLEARFNALDFKVAGVKAWQLSRMTLYYTIAQKYGVEEQGRNKLSNLQKLQSLINYIKNSFIRNPFCKKKCDVVIVSHPQSRIVNEEAIDIYTKYLIDDLRENKVDYLELESVYLGEHQRSPNNNVVYIDFVDLVSRVFKAFYFFNLDEKETVFLNEINKLLSDSFNMKIDVTNIILNNIKDYKIRYYLYLKLFKKLKPKVLYIVVSYGRGAIIKAAKDSNIKVIELQHGTFSDYHLGYSFPNRKEELDYFPHEFLVWSQYWKDLVKFPIPHESVKVKKFEYLEKNKENYQNMDKLDQIVVLSQGNIGNLLASLILEKLEIFNGKKIIYKLHPGEYGRSKNYAALQKLVKLHKNIEVVEDIDLYKLLATSQYQLGVNSTALYEGVEFGCKTILFDTSGIEYMDRFIIFYNLKKVDNLYMSQDIIKDFNI